MTRIHSTLQKPEQKLTCAPFRIPPYLEHEAVNLDVHMLFGFLRVAELVDLHELLQTLLEVEGEKVDPHQTARIQNQLQGVQLDIQVRAWD